MKKITLFILLFTSIPTFAQMMPEWKQKFGMPVFAGADPRFIQFDDSNNVYIFDDIVNYGWGETSNIDPMLRKLNKNGGQLWTKNLGAALAFEEHAYGLALTKNQYLYALYSQTYIGTVLTKFDLNGNIIWTSILGLNENYIYNNITKLKISNSEICHVNVKRYNRNLILKINSSGFIMDSIVVNEGANFGYIDNFEVSSNNKIYAEGIRNVNEYPQISVSYFIDSTHNLLWTKSLNTYAKFSQIIISNDNEIYTAFYSYSDSSKIKIVRINSGNEVWVYRAPKTGNMYWNGWEVYPKLLIDSDGSLIFGGNQFLSTGRNSFFILKLNKNTGLPVWQQDLRQFNVQSTLGDIAKDSSGNYYACGRVEFSNFNSGNSYCILKISNAGEILRTTLNNNYHYSAYFPNHIGIDKLNDVIVSGIMDDTGSYRFYAQSLTIKYSQPVNITQITNSLPNSFSLKQNYPNPFNPNTVISFQLPINSFVNLKVCDINGREVSELVNEKLNAGVYKINFNGASLPSGVYYYKMTIENFSETKKMILVK